MIEPCACARQLLKTCTLCSPVFFFLLFLPYRIFISSLLAAMMAAKKGRAAQLALLDEYLAGKPTEFKVCLFRAHGPLAITSVLCLSPPFLFFVTHTLADNMHPCTCGQGKTYSIRHRSLFLASVIYMTSYRVLLHLITFANYIYIYILVLIFLIKWHRHLYLV